MASTRVPATIDALVALGTAAGATTWDGPVVTGDYNTALFIGYDGDPDGDFLAAEADQEWAGLGAKARDEEFDIICAAVATIGDSVKIARDAVFAMVALLESALRTDPALGQTPPPFTAGFKPGNLFVEPTAAGFQARLVFMVHVKTRV